MRTLTTYDRKVTLSETIPGQAYALTFEVKVSGMYRQHISEFGRKMADVGYTNQVSPRLGVINFTK